MKHILLAAACAVGLIGTPALAKVYASPPAAPPLVQPIPAGVAGPLRSHDSFLIFGDENVYSGFNVSAGWGNFVNNYNSTYHNNYGFLLIPKGIPGATSASVLPQITPALKLSSPTIVVIYVGCNDAQGGVPANAYFVNLYQMVVAIQKCPTVRKIVFMTPCLVGEHFWPQNALDPILDSYESCCYDVASTFDGVGCPIVVVNTREAFKEAEYHYNLGNAGSGILTTDGKNFSVLGHQYFAGCWLTGFGE
jgi:hypothetical protein